MHSELGSKLGYDGQQDLVSLFVYLNWSVIFDLDFVVLEGGVYFHCITFWVYVTSGRFVIFSYMRAVDEIVLIYRKDFRDTPANPKRYQVSWSCYEQQCIQLSATTT